MKRLSALLSRLSPMANTWSAGTTYSWVLFTQPSSRSFRISCFTPFGRVSDIQFAHHLDAVVVGQVVAFGHARAKLAVDIKLASFDLDAVAGQADDPLDVVDARYRAGI